MIRGDDIVILEGDPEDPDNMTAVNGVVRHTVLMATGKQEIVIELGADTTVPNPTDTP